MPVGQVKDKVHFLPKAFCKAKGPTPKSTKLVVRASTSLSSVTIQITYIKSLPFLAPGKYLTEPTFFHHKTFSQYPLPRQIIFDFSKQNTLARPPCCTFTSSRPAPIKMHKTWALVMSPRHAYPQAKETIACSGRSDCPYYPHA